MSTPFPREGYSGRGKVREPLSLTHPRDVEPGQVFYQFYGPPERDTFGRLSFFMYWHDPGLPELCKGTPQEGSTVRGQVFFCDDRERMRRQLAGDLNETGDGLGEALRVFLWPSGEEVTEVP